ncbi:MAG: deoxyribodipyrimidine photo-lyase [Rhodovibrionaceae bacterium]
MSNTAPFLLWFRQDLRLSDNPALEQAASSGRPILALFILDEETPGRWRPGGASRWWLHRSLEAVGAEIATRGGRLVLRRGKAEEVLHRVIEESGAAAVAWNRCYEPYAIARDKALKARLKARGLEVASHNAALLHEPWTVETGQGEPYKVYTPFWKALQAKPAPAAPLAMPGKLAFAKPLQGDALESWNLLPTAPDWAGGLRETWTPGEAGAKTRLERFLDSRIEDYPRGRDFPGEDGTSGLSPHLHWGEIGPRQVWQAVLHRVDKAGRGETAAWKFLSEIGWREFCHHLLYHWPDLPEVSWRENFRNFPWNEDEQALKAWQQGRTGYPIVDAGLRELTATGWMHNRVRMIAGSFLVKDLLIPWQQGEAWFWDTLVDADLANNAAGWQWIAGCGADAAPYFRIFNPVTQSKRFDPSGAYLRKWIPEIADLPDAALHEPWAAPESVLEEAGVKLGESYPNPIVDHGWARKRALDAFATVKKR